MSSRNCATLRHNNTYDLIGNFEQNKCIDLIYHFPGRDGYLGTSIVTNVPRDWF